MKKLMTISMLLLFSITSITFNGCKKPEKGDKGDIGTPGINGTPGNANVKNYAITVTPSQWSYDNLYEIWYYQYNVNENSNSAVLGYVMSGNGKQSMPYYTSVISGAWNEQYDMATYLFGTPPYIEFQYTNFNSRTTKPTSDKYLYLVIMPPAMKKELEDNHIDLKNYEAVTQALNSAD